MTLSFLVYTTAPTLCTDCPGVHQAKNRHVVAPWVPYNVISSCHTTHWLAFEAWVTADGE